MSTDIRWQQRLANYAKALSQLADAVELRQTRALSSLEQQGLIQAFEFTHELAWNVMKDFFVYQGNSDITGSRDATRAAFAAQLVSDGQSWMNMIASRNQSSHTYNSDTADELAAQIAEVYAPLFAAFLDQMTHRRNA
jgi:nucleotidyltransferase substrate binding protein (TIGR01987 family)